MKDIDQNIDNNNKKSITSTCYLAVTQRSFRAVLYSLYNPLFQILHGPTLCQHLLCATIKGGLDVERVFAITKASIRTSSLNQTRTVRYKISKVLLDKSNVAQSRLSVHVKVV
jgi:hypothetical protein